MKRSAVAGLVALGLLTVMPADAAVNAAVAGPGAALAVGYLTPTVVVTPSAPATFVNADPLAPHDVRSVDKRLVGNQLVSLFKSGVINAGQTSEIKFLPDVPAGNYAFICSIHPVTMKGTLMLLEGT